jgi:hypothetical protein
MAREWEAEFIRRWEAGETAEAIAAALWIPEGTGRSRAFTLQREGKLASRPKGGKRTPARGDDSPAPARAPLPVQGIDTGAVSSVAPVQCRGLIGLGARSRAYDISSKP